LNVGVENAEPLFALLHSNARAVICTRHVLAFGSLLHRRFVRNHGNVSAGEDDLYVGKRIVAQIGLRHVRDFPVQGLNPLGIFAIVLFRAKLLESFTLFVFVSPAKLTFPSIIAVSFEADLADFA